MGVPENPMRLRMEEAARMAGLTTSSTSSTTIEPHDRRVLHGRRRRGPPRGVQVLAGGVCGAPADAGGHCAHRLAFGRPRLLAIGQGAVRRHDGGEGRRVADPASAQSRRRRHQPQEPPGDRLQAARADRRDGAARQGGRPGRRGDPRRRLPDRGQDRLHHGLARREAGRGEEDRLPLRVDREGSARRWRWRSRGEGRRSRCCGLAGTSCRSWTTRRVERVADMVA